MSATGTGRDFVVFFLYAGIFLGAHNIYVNAIHAFKRPLIINIIQAIASVLQCLNQAWLTILFTQSATQILGGECFTLMQVGNINFLLFQILCSGVLLYRATSLLDEKVKNYARFGLGTIFLASFSFLTISCMGLPVFLVNDRCVPEIDRPLNYTGKILLAFLYLLLLPSFVLPLVRYIRKIQATSKTINVDRVRKVLLGVSFKISLAIVAYLITVALSLANIGNIYMFVEFTLQNYFAILASTVAFSKRRAQNVSSGSSAPHTKTTLTSKRLTGPNNRYFSSGNV
jgi:hypothetical protein